MTPFSIKRPIFSEHSHLTLTILNLHRDRGKKGKGEKSISREKTFKKLNVSVDSFSSLAFIRGGKIPKTFHSFVSILATHQKKKVKENEKGGGGAANGQAAK